MKRIQLFEQFIKEGKFDKPIKLSVKKSRKNPYTFSHKMDNEELYKLFFQAMGKEVADKEELDGYKDTDYKKARIDIFNIMMSRGANPYRDKRTWADDWEEEEYDIDEQFVNEAVNIKKEIKKVANYFDDTEVSDVEVYVKDYVEDEDVSSYGYMFWWNAEDQECGIEYQNTPGSDESEDPCKTADDFIKYVNQNT